MDISAKTNGPSPTFYASTYGMLTVVRPKRRLSTTASLKVLLTQLPLSNEYGEYYKAAEVSEIHK